MPGLALKKTLSELHTAGCAMEEVIHAPVAVVVRTPNGQRRAIQWLGDGSYAITPGLLRYNSVREAISAACADDPVACAA